jgi:hypothetical protein
MTDRNPGRDPDGTRSLDLDAVRSCFLLLRTNDYLSTEPPIRRVTDHISHVDLAAKFGHELLHALPRFLMFIGREVVVT